MGRNHDELVRKEIAANTSRLKKKAKKRKAKRKNAEPVIFVEGGIVQALLMPSDIEKTGYREQSFELVDYDVFDDMEEENIFFMWSGFSDRLKKYFDKCLPDEKQKFLDRIQEWQDRVDAEAKQQPKSHSADLTEDGVGMEIFHCDFCDTELEEGRIGKCDDCLALQRKQGQNQ